MGKATKIHKTNNSMEMIKPREYSLRDPHFWWISGSWKADRIYQGAPTNLPHPQPTPTPAMHTHTHRQWTEQLAGENTQLEPQGLFFKQNRVSVKDGWTVWVFYAGRWLITATLDPAAGGRGEKGVRNGIWLGTKDSKVLLYPQIVVLLFWQLQSEPPFSLPLTLKGSLPMCGIRQLTQIQWSF